MRRTEGYKSMSKERFLRLLMNQNAIPLNHQGVEAILIMLE